MKVSDIMASTEEYKNFILEKLSIINNITYKPMMGKYLLYYKNKLFGEIYDDRLMIKKVDSNKVFNMEGNISYKGAKLMYLVDNIDDSEKLRDIVLTTYKDLK